MCYGAHPFLSKDDLTPPPWEAEPANGSTVVDDLRSRLAETQARLEQARAREAELSRRLEEMKRFVSVMGILENYLKERFLERQQQVASASRRIIFPVPKNK